jgi:hypothetical protein
MWLLESEIISTIISFIKTHTITIKVKGIKFLTYQNAGCRAAERFHAEVLSQRKNKSE